LTQQNRDAAGLSLGLAAMAKRPTIKQHSGRRKSLARTVRVELVASVASTQPAFSFR
jgi:hypothetical protein